MVEREQWPEFCRVFSRQHSRRRCYVLAVPTEELDQGYEPDDVERRVWKARVVLFDLAMAPGGASARLTAGVRPDVRAETYFLDNLVGLFGQRGPDRATDGIRIVTDDGFSTIVRLTVAATPDPVAGWTAAVTGDLGGL